MKSLFNDILDFLSTFRGKVVVALIVIALGCSAGIYKAGQAGRDAQKALAAFAKESKERRDASCKSDEREHKRDVDNLIGSYDYLDRILAKNPDRIRSNTPQAVIRNLSSTEEKARTDVAPEFCDAKGIGLPEPDPKLPPKQDYSKYLLN